MWWCNRKRNHLPVSSGPYSPGATDVMLDYSRNGLFVRLYYPTDAKKNDEETKKKWFPWMPDDTYVNGVAYVLMLFSFIIHFLMWWTANTLIPAMYGEKIKKDKKLKCIILSHGLGGTRFLYSSVCCELASHGYLVFAIEHRDNTAANTYYYQSKEDAAIDKRTNIRFKRINLDKKHYQKRNEQVHFRSNECSKTLDLIFELNDGKVPYNVLEDVPNSQKEINFRLDDLVGNLDSDNVIMMGHSFGGASALMTLSQRSELKQGILMDPWMFPIKNENLHEAVKQPLIFINTQTFHISTNVEVMAKYLLEENRKMYTILHTTHENQSDTVVIIGYWLNWFMKKLNGQLALKINHSLILRFLNEYTGFPELVDEQVNLLKEQSSNVAAGLTKPWV